MDDLDLDVELEELEATVAPPSGSEVDWQREAEKARKEAHGLRERLRRTEVASEYGKEVAELIPTNLPIKEWKGYAERLVAFRGQATATDQQTTSESAEPAQEQPSEDDKKLSQALKGSATGTPATDKVSALQWMSLRQNNPSEADRLLRSGSVEGVTQ
jgi:hypothetical protein